MKKKECAIVQDLLVLYEDHMLQEESMQMVEEHIRGCEECMRIYENAGKELPISVEEAEKSEEKQDEEASKVMKRAYRRITYKHVKILYGILVALLITIFIVNEICNQFLDYGEGIVGMIYSIPADKIEVTDLYQLKNGDIYCTLKSEKQIGIQAIGEWQIPDDKFTQNTDEAFTEVYFRQRAPWEWNNAEFYQTTMVFATSRQGTLKESGEEIIQNCCEISYRGRNVSDKLIIWQRGQKVPEAPEEIEQKAIEEYIRDSQIGKAKQECENMGWDIDEIISEVYREDRDIWYEMGGSADEEDVVFRHNFETVTIYD